MSNASANAGTRFQPAAMLALATRPLTIALAVIVLMLAIGEAVSPGFASPQQIVRQLTIAALFGMVAAGQNLVILGGREGIDLSVGALVSLGALVAGNVMQMDNAMILPALVLTLAVTFGIGLLNGLGATVLRIPPLVMTLGMAGVLQGALVLLTRGVPSGKAAPMLTQFISAPLVLGIPGLLFVWAAVGAALVFFLRRTPFGLKVYAVGANEEAAALAGIPVRRVRILLFGLSGMFAGLTGFFVLGYTSSVFIGIGNQYVLPSIIAVVIGGTSLAGGVGGYLGTMAGAVVLVLLRSILTTLNIEAYGREIIFGATLLVLMLFYGRQRRLRA
jgi:ribose transport system permease protein